MTSLDSISTKSKGSSSSSPSSLSSTFIVDNKNNANFNETNKIATDQSKDLLDDGLKAKVSDNSCNDLVVPVPNDELDILIKMERANK